MTSETRLPIDDPRLLPFLPYIYLAWSDGELTEAEVENIRANVESSYQADALTSAALKMWLDPTKPPTPSELTDILAFIRRQLNSSGESAPTNLTTLELAALADRLAKSGRDGSSLSDYEQSTVAELGEQLGLVGTEPSRALLGPVLADSQNSDAKHIGSQHREDPADRSSPNAEIDFDAAKLGDLRDGDRAAIRNQVRTLLTEPDFAHRHGLSIDEYRQRTLDQTIRLADAGLGRLGMPTEVGGNGDVSDFMGAFSVLGHHDLSLLTKYGVQFGLFGGAIMRLGSQSHHEKYLPGAMDMTLPGCFAMTETAHGSNVQQLETTATFDPASDSFIVNTPHPAARKDYIGNAANDGKLAVVFAQLITENESHGVHAFVVPLRNDQGTALPGVTIEDDGPKAGLNGVDNGRLSFASVSIPRTNLLDRFASVDADGTYHSDIPSKGKRFFTTIGTLVGGRIGVGTAAISAAETSLAIAVRYGSTRRQFGAEGQPETILLDYPSHQRRLMPLLAATYAYRFALEHLADDYAEERLAGRELEGHAAGLKAMGTWLGNQTIQECREACGGAGYLAENRLGPLKADADVFQTYEGDNTVLLQLVARGLLSNYAQQFNDMSLLGSVRFLASRALETVREANPLVIGGGGEDDLRDRERYIDLFRWREDHLVAALGSRLKKRIGNGMDSAEAFAQLQNHAINAAKAHVEHLVLQRFVAAIENINETNGPERQVLELLCDLFALSRLEADRGWFQEHAKLSAGASKSLRTVVSSLCSQVGANALPLVEAFAIPDAVIGAPIALGQSGQ